MPEAFYILFGGVFTAGAMLAAGLLLLPGSEDRLFAFTVGAAAWTLIVYALAAAGMAARVPILVAGLLLTALALAFRGRPRLALLPLWCWPVLAIFGALYIINAMAPERSPSVQLGVISQAYRLRQPVPLTGMHSLLLSGWAFGRHSGAALVHLSFLFALPCLIVGYGRRFGFEKAALAGAILAFVSPAMAVDATQASAHAATATAFFGAFLALRIYAEHKKTRLLAIAAVQLAFACLAYTTAPHAFPGHAFLLVPLGVLALRRLDGILVAAAGCAALFLGGIVPAIPFAALLIGMAVAPLSWAGWALVVFQAFAAWPPVMRTWSNESVSMLSYFPVRAALRLQSEDAYLRPQTWHLYAKLIEQETPEGATVFMTKPHAAQSYTTRKLVVSPGFKDARYVLIEDSEGYGPHPDWKLKGRWAWAAVYETGARP